MRLLIGTTTMGRVMVACGLPIRDHHRSIENNEVALYVEEEDDNSSVRLGEVDWPYLQVENGYIEAIRRLCRMGGLL